MVNEAFWHIGKTASLSWGKLPGLPEVATVFHSGNGQTFAVDPLGCALLKTLENGPMTQSRILDELAAQSVLPPNQEGHRQLSQALRQLHTSAIINRTWQDDERSAA